MNNLVWVKDSFGNLLTERGRFTLVKKSGIYKYTYNFFEPEPEETVKNVLHVTLQKENIFMKLIKLFIKLLKKVGAKCKLQ